MEIFWASLKSITFFVKTATWDIFVLKAINLAAEDHKRFDAAK